MKPIIKMEFGITEEEGWADYNRCNNEDVFIDDYTNGRWVMNAILYSGGIHTLEELEGYAAKVYNALLKKQDNEVWLIGLGYVEKTKVTPFLKLKGLIKKLLTFRIYFYKKNSLDEEFPF